MLFPRSQWRICRSCDRRSRFKAVCTLFCRAQPCGRIQAQKYVHRAVFNIGLCIRHFFVWKSTRSQSVVVFKGVNVQSDFTVHLFRAGSATICIIGVEEMGATSSTDRCFCCKSCGCAGYTWEAGRGDSRTSAKIFCLTEAAIAAMRVKQLWPTPDAAGQRQHRRQWVRLQCCTAAQRDPSVCYGAASARRSCVSYDTVGARNSDALERNPAAPQSAAVAEHTHNAGRHCKYYFPP